MILIYLFPFYTRLIIVDKNCWLISEPVGELKKGVVRKGKYYLAIITAA